MLNVVTYIDCTQKSLQFAVRFGAMGHILVLRRLMIEANTSNLEYALFILERGAGSGDGSSSFS